jgi:predicted Zn-dependent protease
VKLFISYLAFCVVACGQISREKEVALGQTAFRDLVSRERVLTDPAVGAFADGVVRKVSSGRAVRVSPHVTVFDTAELVASALPGGHLLVSSGAIMQAQDEAQFAALIAHAMGHMQAGMSVQRATANGGLPIVFIGGPWGSCVRSAGGSANILLPAYLQASWAKSEIEADVEALAFMRPGGYDPEAFLQVFDTWKTAYPLTPDTREAARRLVNTAEITVSDSSAFIEVKERLAAIVTPRHVPSLY